MDKVTLLKRFKSLLWRIAMMIAAFGIQFVLDNLGLFGLSTNTTIVVGLVLGEVSKLINSNH